MSEIKRLQAGHSVTGVDIKAYGHLEGKVWVFNDAQLLDGKEIKRIDFSQAIIPKDAPPFEQLVEETVIAFLDPETVHSDYDGYMRFPSQS